MLEAVLGILHQEAVRCSVQASRSEIRKAWANLCDAIESVMKLI